jgi:hypothetical protein
VTNSRIDGNAENSRGRNTYIPTSNITIANVILKLKNRSSIMGGMGMIITMRIHMVAKPIITSEFFVRKPKRPGVCVA